MCSTTVLLICVVYYSTGIVVMHGVLYVQYDSIVGMWYVLLVCSIVGMCGICTVSIYCWYL